MIIRIPVAYISGLGVALFFVKKGQNRCTLLYGLLMGQYCLPCVIFGLYVGYR